MKNITVKRGNDGFGSQLMSIISGLAYAKTNNLNYLHSPISNIKLLDKNEFQNTDLDRANELIFNVIKNLGYLNYTGSEECLSRPFYHDIIYQKGTDKYYTESFLNELPMAYKNLAPKYYKDSFNIGIHIRRGSDIFNQNDINVRIIPNEVYEKIINLLQKIYPEATIRIFSWTDPKLNIDESNVKYQITNTGDLFLDDFNALVHSDILFVGSSTFSISAGFFCKGIVVCGPELCKLKNTPIPTRWKKNYKIIIENEKFYV
jgi:hypothetical protein